MSPSASRPKRLLVSGGRGRLAALVAGHFRAPAHEVALFSREGAPGFRSLAELTAPDSLASAGTLLHLAWSTLPATAEQAPATAESTDYFLLEKILHSLAALPP